MIKGIDYIGVALCCVCHDGQGRVLLNRRTQKCRDEWGCWDNWGGALERGESFEEGIRRELKEEAGVTPLKIEGGEALNVIREHQGQQTHWVAIIFAVQVDPKKVKIGEPEKFSECKWFEYGKWPSPLHSFFHQDVAKVEKFLKVSIV